MNHIPNDKPFSQACENNKRVILRVLEQAFANCRQVLEIGSGTGQHAVFLAEHLPHLIWHTSDQPHYHQGISAWIDEANVGNLKHPIPFTIGHDAFPHIDVDGVFTANTAHIMQREEVKLLMELVASHLPQGGMFCQYGPFTHSGKFTSESNQAFHLSLLERGYGGYRDINELTEWAPGLRLIKTIDMPANNHMLVWQKA
ncbi:DUF938 domain-containing protein [Alteromonas gracilis]|uniref:DUF938 domain-containing protein n=1 Tax=Alteromonas gracilis TaxID=1479524 RepID=UPI0037355F25